MTLPARMFAQYGTHRGMVRLWLDTMKWKLGRYRPHDEVDWARVRRLVFVCQGNICRSPYAHCLAAQHSTAVASFGYATSSGMPANALAQEVALARGTSMASHQTTDLSAFTVEDGDLLLVMEDRHLSRVAPATRDKDVQVTLLGLWSSPPRALIYDPHHVSEAYFHVCYGVIESAVENVIRHLQQARAPAAACAPNC